MTELAEEKKKVIVGTSCRFCEFKVQNPDGVQTGCELFLLDRYNAPMELKSYDDEHGKGEAYEIGTFCLYRRPPGWKKAKEQYLVDGKTFADIAREEMKIAVTLVVHLRSGDNFEQVVDFVKHVNEMTVKPTKIIFMNFAHISPLTFLRLNDLTKIEWSMEFMLDNSKEDEILRKNGFDLASKKVKSSYFVALSASDLLPLDYIEVIEKAIIDDLQKFVAILDDQEKPNFYQTIVYRSVRGNEQADANEKIKWMAEDQECLHLIKTPEQIFPKSL